MTGIAQWIVDGKPLGLRDVAAVMLVSISIYLHAQYPVKKVEKVEMHDKKRQ